MKKILAILLSLMLLVGMAPALAESAGVTYTYSVTMGSSPLNWNEHAWEVSNENDLQSYINLPLAEPTIAEDGVNFKWLYEGADAVTDITADFADKEAWGIPADAAEMRVFQVDLNPAAKWANGDVINADSYVYSMKALLDPAMKNYRSNTYITGTAAVLNAGLYFNNDKVGQPILAPMGSLEFKTSADAIAAGKDKLYVDVKGFWNVEPEDGVTIRPITDEVEIRDPAVAEDKPEAFVSAKYLYDTYLADGMVYASAAPDVVYVENGTYEETPWEKVGFYKTGEYQFIYITEAPCSMFDFLISCTSTWLVYEPLYEAGKETKEGLVATNYGTDVDNYMAAGPYKMVSFEKDKQIVLERNEYWFGYTDGKHEGQFVPDRIKIDIIGDHNTELLLFNQGKLDSAALTSNDLPTYRMSDYLQKTDETYTFRFIFATSLDTLKALEQEANDGANKQVLSYKDFRKAISLAIDRTTFCAQATSAFKPAYYLYNSLYYYNIANDTNSIYRNTDIAKMAVLNLYGIQYGEGTPYATVDDAYSAVTGYDVDEARALFQGVYEQAIKDGRYTEGQEIHINTMASAADTMSADDTKQQDMLNQFVAEATKGTGFEGKITFKFSTGSKTRYDDVANGKIEMIRGAWGGAAFYPFSSIRTYTEPENMGGVNKIHESNGWDPTVELLDVTFDFDKDGTAETLSDTFQNWAKSINGGGKYYQMPEESLAILSALETGVLSAYQCIPFGVSVACALYSQKVTPATLNYNIMYGYGGIRLLKFNYTDAEWDAYVASQGGQLNYE